MSSWVKDRSAPTRPPNPHAGSFAPTRQPFQGHQTSSNGIGGAGTAQLLQRRQDTVQTNGNQSQFAENAMAQGKGLGKRC